MLATGELPWMLAGAFVLQVWVLLDHTDGEVARLRRYRGLPGSASVEGAFSEYVGNHLVVHPLTLAFLGIGAYRLWGEVAFLFLGFAASFASILSMAIWLRKHMLLMKFVYMDPDHEAAFMGQTPEGHLREKGVAGHAATAGPAPEPGPTGGPRFNAMGALRAVLGWTSNFIEFAFLVIVALLADLALAAAGIAPLVPGLLLHGALALLLYYGGVFFLATLASIFTNVRFQIAHDLAGYVAHRRAQVARARGEAVALPDPVDEH